MREMKHLTGATGIILSTGSTAARPASTTRFSFADSTTDCCTRAIGPSTSDTTDDPSSRHPPGSTHANDHVTTPTTDDSEG